MATGKKKSQYHYFWLKLINTKVDDNTPIAIEIKDSISKEVISSENDFVSGQLYDIRFDEVEFKEEKFRTVKIFIRDNKEMYVLGGRMNNYFRKILNRLLSIVDPFNVEISVFENQEREKRISVRSHNEKLEYMFDLNYQKPYIEEVKRADGKLERLIYDKWGEHLIEKVKEILIPKLEELKQKEKTETTDRSVSAQDVSGNSNQITEETPDTEPDQEEDINPTEDKDNNTQTSQDDGLPF